MQTYFTDRFDLPLPLGHRFPMAKYRRLRAAVATGVPTARLVEPPAATDDQLEGVHDRAYVQAVTDGTLDPAAVRRIGFPWSRQLVERSRRSVGATIAACRSALAEGVAVNLAGGTHHAFADRGGGFCVWNDAAVAARTLLSDGDVGRVAIIDLDVHQGDGTAAILATDPRVFTLSVHGAKNFPFVKQQSDLDVALDDGTGDEAYLAALEGALEEVFEATVPDLVIYLAGADPWHGDRLGRLALTKAGLRARDARVFECVRAHGCALAVVMAGGYAREIDDIVDIHLATVSGAASLHHAGTEPFP